MNRTLATGLVMTILLSGNAVIAASLQSHASIKATAEQFISAAVEASHGLTPEVTAGGLDSRLRLSGCDLPLEAFLPTGGRLLGNVTVGVRCTGSRPWSLYVPVRVALFGKVVVAARPLTRNGVLTRADLKLERRDLAQLHTGYFTDPAGLVGKKVSRNIAMNATLGTDQVRDPLAVKRGQRVELVAAGNGIEVRMKGEAMADGAAGDRIKVRNLSSRRVVDGVVDASGAIQVAM